MKGEIGLFAIRDKADVGIQPHYGIDLSGLKIQSKPINQEELDIINKKRSNLFSWNGQFSPQLIESILKAYGTNSKHVLDPFSGSGTTLIESASYGISVSGIELNPAAYYMSSVYKWCNVLIENRENLLKHIEEKLDGCGWNVDEIPKLTTKNKLLDNTISLLMVIIDLYKNNFSREVVQEKWNNLKKTILELPYSDRNIQAILGDSRIINKVGEKPDLVITSPPYINVFNYHQAYRKSVEALGYNVLKIAKSEFGANRKFRSNRFNIVTQYCIDMAQHFFDLIRNTTDDCRLVYIVGRESKILKIPFCNSGLIVAIWVDVFGMEIENRQERKFKNRFGQIIYEDILVMKKNKYANELSIEEVICGAKEVARCAFLLALEDENAIGNIGLIENAIINIDKIIGSEVFYE